MIILCQQITKGKVQEIHHEEEKKKKLKKITN